MTAPLVMLAAGGTGGHMFPAEALARALLERGVPVALITDRRGQAFGDALPEVKVHRIRAGRMGQGIGAKLRALLDMGLGFFNARRLIRDLKPAAIVGFGGYPSIPTVLAASALNIPVILHDQNALLGRANRRLARRARKVATSFDKVMGVPDGIAAVPTGNPVRPAILPVRDIPYPALSPDGRISILVMGGSQGAHVFSEVVPAAMALLPPQLKSRIAIVQQCRAEDIGAARAAFAATGVNAELATFFNDVPRRLADCHLAVTRSGASTVAELGVAGRPAVLVPYPFATDDHQFANANAFAADGAGWVVRQRAFTPQWLAERIETLAAMPDQLVRGAAAARAAGRPDAARLLAELVIAEIGGEGTMRPFDFSADRDPHLFLQAAE